jgi:hypothetical protein
MFALGLALIVGGGVALGWNTARRVTRYMPAGEVFTHPTEVFSPAQRGLRRASKFQRRRSALPPTIDRIRSSRSP